MLLYKPASSGDFSLSYTPRHCLACGMEDDPDYRQINRYMAAFIILPTIAYGIVRMLLHLLA